ncbi:MAG: POTRA domain-containing protein [Crocinitomicaceae bacterium]
MIKGILLAAFLSVGFFLKATIIDTIEFTGLTKTSESYIRSLIECKEGLPFNDSVRRLDEQTLNNLNLFFSVESTYQFLPLKKAYKVIFNIKESTYIYPIIDISGFQSVLKLQLGVNNINFKGEQKTVGFWYQYYDRHSFSIYHRVPRYKKQPFGHDLIISKYSTVEPLYFNDLTSIFNFDNYSVNLNGIHWLSRFTNVQLGFTPIYEVYEQLDSVELNLPSREFSFWKYRLNSSLNIKKIDYLYERLKGFKSTIYAESIQTHDMPNASFYMAKLTTVYHYLIKKKGNLSWRHQIGISTNNFSPFSPFVLDGFMNLRGIGNRVARGTGIHFVNLEYRHLIINNNIFSTQIVGFADLGSIRPPAESINHLFNPEYTKTFAGVGIRIHSNKIYKAIFRIDYGIQLGKEFRGGLSFGIGQFF